MALQKYLEHFFKVPFSDPFHRPFGKGKKGTCKKLEPKQRKETKGYNANNTSKHLPSLELMKWQCLLYKLLPQGNLDSHCGNERFEKCLKGAILLVF